MPKNSIYREDVKKSMKLLIEKKVELQDIPTEYQDSKMFNDDFILYRYSFLLPPFSFHVLYDPNEVIIETIPTYE